VSGETYILKLFSGDEIIKNGIGSLCRSERKWKAYKGFLHGILRARDHSVTRHRKEDNIKKNHLEMGWGR
jgi:hypothetical protein